MLTCAFYIPDGKLAESSDTNELGELVRPKIQPIYQLVPVFYLSWISL